LASQRLSEREAQGETSPQEGGQEEECVEAREDQADMDLGEEREDSTLILGNIGSPTKETTP
jgi:hypothetical protein